ncbi:MAG: hypothetical protein K2I94_02845, partial [Muribaculaceae bacterium]|nr:hypothetical protein [Muribaculaceae bacterium]
MKLELKIFNKIFVALIALFVGLSAKADSIPCDESHPLVWRVGFDISPAWGPGTSSFLRGDNLENNHINSVISGDL